MGPLPTQSASIYPWKRVLPTLDVSYHATKLGFDALRGKVWWLVSFKADKPAGINLVLYLQTIRVTIDIAEIFRNRQGCVARRGQHSSISVLDFPLWLVGSVLDSDSLVEVLTEIGIKDAKFWK